MKKLLVCLLCLCLALPCLGGAEEKNAPAPLLEAFQENAQAVLQKISNAGAMHLSVKPAGEESLDLLARMDAQSGLMDVTLRVPGQETPVILQSDGQVFWLSAGGQTYQLALEEIQKLLQNLQQASALPQMDPQIAQELVQMLLASTVLPGIQVETPQENSTVVKIDLKGKALIAGLCAFLDQVTASERYRGALEPLIAQIAARQGYTGDLAAEWDKAWPEMKEELLSVETDAALTGTVIIARADSAVRVEATLAYTEKGETLSAHLSAADLPEQFSLTAGWTAAEQDTGALALTVNKPTGLVNASLDINGGLTKIQLNGEHHAKAAQYKIDIYENGVLRSTADVNRVSGDSTTAVTAVMTSDGETGACTLYAGRNALQFSVQGSDAMLSLNAQKDDAGRISSARVAWGDGRRESWDLAWDGEKIVYQDPQQLVTISGFCEDEKTHVIDVAVTDLRYARRQGDAQTAHAYIRTVLDDTQGREKIDVRLLTPQGDEALNAYLAAEEATPVTPLSQMNPVVLDAEMLQQLIQYSFSASAQGNSAPVAGE